MTISKVDQLIENYVTHIIDGLDYKDMEQMVYDLLTREYEKYTEEDIKEEILDLYDEEILEGLMPTEDS